MPIVDDDVIIEVEFTNGVGSSDPLAFSYLGITGLDTNRSAASQLTILIYFTEFSDGTTVENGTFTNWYDPYLIKPTDESGNVFLDFDDARGIVTIQNLELSTVTFANGTTTKTRKALSDSTYTKVRIMRSQNITNKSHTFQSGSRITSDSLNNAIGQIFDATQELDDRLVRVEGATFEEGIVLNSVDLPVIPVIKGGTGATTAGAARTALGADDASNLTTGTIPNARITALPKTNILAAADDIINKTVGTSANNVVALDGLGKLPAVDGSQLINLPSSGTGGLIDSVAITAGNGLDVTQSTTVGGDYTATLSADLKANGGIVIESTELAVDLGASSITGTLGVLDGGTGLTSISTLLNSNTTKGDVGLGNVENTALSTWAGSGNITQVGTITSGTWNGTAIAYADVSGTPTLGTAAAANTGDFAAASHTHAQSEITNLVTDLAAKSPLAGSSSIVTTGTITTGTWNATAIEDTKIDLRVDHGVTFDGQGSVIETAKTVYVPVERDGVIKAATLVGDASGSATITITRYNPAADATTLGLPASVGSIALASKIINRDTTLSGWTTAVSEGDILAFTTGGTLATVTRLTCKLKMELA